MTKLKIYILLAALLMLSSGCSGAPTERLHKYSGSFFDTFDTLVQVVAYTETREEFDNYMAMIHERFIELHQLYDIYLNYEGLNNIKTINDNAGIKPVVVDTRIIDLILFSKEMSEKTGYKTNIALGPVLKIWHRYREEAGFNPEAARIPPLNELKEAYLYTDLDQVIVDLEQNTVYLSDAQMSLDVGAVAKGFATELVARELEEAGLKTAVLSPGGNIRTIGRPQDGLRDKWAVGIQNPQSSLVAESDRLLDVVFVQDSAVVTSGDYQRYYLVDGEVMHHIIDVDTLMPAKFYRALTVVAPDAALADFLSTALFLLPFEESKALAESFAGVEVYWVFADGRVEITNGLRTMLQSYGATNQKQ